MDTKGTINRFIYRIIDFIEPSLNIKFKTYEEKILYYIISMTLIIDFLNGFFITYLGIDSFTIGKIFRISILIICSLYMLRYDLKSI